MIIKGDCIEELKKLPENSVDAIVTDPPYGLEFMGKNWDNGVPGKPFFIEMIRVLKPGGFLLSFGGTRTYHRMVCGIEDAGFEIRDTIMWLYGSGFPKSLNIGKAVDKLQGNEREVVGENPNYRPISGKVGFLKKSNFRQTDGMSISTKGSSPHEGWGTALKPAHEPIVVARKPLSEKNVALNVLKWGTGGINIDACRIGSEIITQHGRKEKDGGGWNNHWHNDLEKGKQWQGRFPANIILDEEAGEILGEPSRFFYCAKASKSERNYGCEDFEARAKCEIDKMGGEKYSMKTGSGNERNVAYKNNHPTVKPIKLMEYLIKLVSKEGATVLDPFLGSGTTAIACLKQNRKYIGIEKEEEYIKIAEARLKPFIEQGVLF